MYSKRVMDHFRKPRNMGEMDKPDVVGQLGNPVCGDVMKIYLKVGRGESWKKHVIEEISFQTLGCVAAVATTSIMTEMVKGKSFGEAKELSNQAIAEALGGLPPLKMHCSNLAADVLQKAMRDYK